MRKYKHTYTSVCLSVCIFYSFSVFLCVLKDVCRRVYFHGDGSRLKQLMRHVGENLFVVVVMEICAR